MSERLQNKMQNYEVAPPSNVWSKITAALDESEMDHEFPSKLYNAEITPPSTVWDKIRASIDEENKTVPINKKRLPIIRYAVAAAIIGLLALGGVQLFKGKSSGTITANQPDTSKILDKLVKQENINAAPEITSQEQKDDDALQESRQTIAKLDVPKKVKRNFSSYQTEEAVANEFDYTSNITSTENNLSNRYIAVMTPDCNVVRVSKKLDHLVCCVAGDDNSPVCQDQLQKWREKIASSTIAPSPGNFLDIVSLVSSLQD